VLVRQEKEKLLMIHIRQATPNDLDMLVYLRLALIQETSCLRSGTEVKVVKEATREYIFNALPDGRFKAWIAESRDGKMIGISGLTFFERPPLYGNLSGLEAYVMNMYTDPEWRGRGIATVLLPTRCATR